MFVTEKTPGTLFASDVDEVFVGLVRDHAGA
jgi:hypothetical protein